VNIISSAINLTKVSTSRWFSDKNSVKSLLLAAKTFRYEGRFPDSARLREWHEHLIVRHGLIHKPKKNFMLLSYLDESNASLEWIQPIWCKDNIAA
jgi:hypothetical protein